MSKPTPGQVHVDTALTNISVAFRQSQDAFVASRVFPNVPVMKQSDRYYVFDRGDFFRSETAKRAPNTESAGRDYSVDNTPNYYADVHAIHHDVSDQLMANADPVVDPERVAAELAMQDMMISQEASWMSSYFGTGVWGTDVSGVASSPGTGETIKWSDTTSGDPIGDIRAAKTAVLESTGRRPNTLVLQRHVMDALEDHPDIVDRVKYSGGVGNGNPAKVNEQTLAALFGLERILVAEAVQNTAAQGQTASVSFIGGKNALLCYAAPTPALMMPSAGYTFSWNGFMGQSNAFGIATKRFYIDRLESTRIEVQSAYTHKVVAPEMGYFWDSIAA
jgi:hypothetical protein